MASPMSFLLALLSTVLQFAVSVDAKGGGKNSGSKGSKPKSKSTPKYKSGPVVYHENGYCYDAQHDQVSCPASKTNLIITIVLGAICALLLIATVVIYFKGRWKEKRGKSLDPKSMVPLVEGESKETDSVYSYEDKDTKV